MSALKIDLKKHLVFAACAGAIVASSAIFFTADNSDQSQKILVMENRIKSLEALLEKKETDLQRTRMLLLTTNNKQKITSINKNSDVTASALENNLEQNNSEQVATVTSSIQTLKDLGTHSARDPRSFTEKASELLAGDASKEKVAIVSKGIFDMANDRESLPDYALQSLYASQNDPDVKRVIAQVLSQRGNNALIENNIAEARAQLKSNNPGERQIALQNLAKTHYVNAASVAAPMLYDADINVRLDALLALGATGNQSHLTLVEKLFNDPDPAVSSLAKEVASNLKNLSDSARTNLSSRDIAAELPIMEHP